MKDSKWDRRYLELAQHVATWSKDPTTKVGAVAIGIDPRCIAVGYNGFPPGIVDDPARYEHRPTKYLYTQHAERNVLDNAHFDLKGATLATTMFPCVECTKSMISKGIAKLVSPKPPEPIAEPSWRDTVKTSIAMLKEARVRIVILEEAKVEVERT